MKSVIAALLAALVISAQAPMPSTALANRLPALGTPQNLAEGSVGENTEAGAYALLYLAYAYAALDPTASANYLFLLFDMWDITAARLEVLYRNVLFAEENRIITPLSDLTVVRELLDNGNEKIGIAKDRYKESIKYPPIEIEVLTEIYALATSALNDSSNARSTLEPDAAAFADIVKGIYNGALTTVGVLETNVSELEKEGVEVSYYRGIIEQAKADLNRIAQSYIRNAAIGVYMTDNLPEIYAETNAVVQTLSPVVGDVLKDMKNAVTLTPGFLLVVGGGPYQDVYVGQTTTLMATWSATNSFTTALTDVPITVEAPPNSTITVDGTIVSASVDASGLKPKFSFAIANMPQGTSRIVVTYQDILAAVQSEDGWKQRENVIVAQPVAFEKNITVAKNENISPFEESSVWRYVLPIVDLPSETASELTLSAKCGSEQLTVSGNNVFFNIGGDPATVAVTVKDLPPAVVFENVVVKGSEISFSAVVRNWSSAKYENIIIDTPLPYLDAFKSATGGVLNNNGVLAVIIASLAAESSVAVDVSGETKDMFGFASSVLDNITKKYQDIKQMMKNIGMYEQYAITLEDIYGRIALATENLIRYGHTSLVITSGMHLFGELLEFKTLTNHVAMGGAEVAFSGWAPAIISVDDRTRVIGTVTLTNRTNKTNRVTLRVLVPRYIENIKIKFGNTTISFPNGEIVYPVDLVSDWGAMLSITGDAVLAVSRQTPFKQVEQYVTCLRYVQISGRFLVEYAPLAPWAYPVKLTKELPSRTLRWVSVSASSDDPFLEYVFGARLAARYRTINNPDVVNVAYLDDQPEHEIISTAVAKQGGIYHLTINGVISNFSDTKYENILVYLNSPRGISDTFSVSPADKVSIYSPMPGENGVPVLLLKSLGSSENYLLTYAADDNGIDNYLSATNQRYGDVDARAKELASWFSQAIYDNVSDNLKGARELIDNAAILVQNAFFENAFHALIDANELLDKIEQRLGELEMSFIEMNEGERPTEDELFGEVDPALLEELLENIRLSKEKITQYRLIIDQLDNYENTASIRDLLLETESLLHDAETAALLENLDQSTELLRSANEKLESISLEMYSQAEKAIVSVSPNASYLLSLFENIRGALTSENILPETLARLENIIGAARSALENAEKLEQTDIFSSLQEYKRAESLLASETSWLRSELSAFVAYEEQYVENLRALIRWSEATGAPSFAQSASSLNDIDNALKLSPTDDVDFLKHAMDTYLTFDSTRDSIMKSVNEHIAGLIKLLTETSRMLGQMEDNIANVFSMLQNSRPHTASKPSAEKFKQAAELVKDILPVLYPPAKMVSDSITHSAASELLEALLENIATAKGLSGLDFLTGYLALLSSVENGANLAWGYFSTLKVSLNSVISRVRAKQAYARAIITNNAENNVFFSAAMGWYTTSVALLGDGDPYGAMVCALVPISMLDRAVVLPPFEPPDNTMYYIAAAMVVILIVVPVLLYARKRGSKPARRTPLL
jgi:hypothetical protein